MLSGSTAVTRTGLDAAALKPAEVDLGRAASLVADGTLAVDRLVVDWEGHGEVPARTTLERLAATTDLRLTTPVRAAGYDPLGDDDRLDALPTGVGRVLVAGHPSYLSDRERSKAIAPRLGAATGDDPDAWVGTESVERTALATGNPQFELLSRSTARDVRSLRAAGYEGAVAVYAPTVLTDDGDAHLDALGDYVARRGPVADALPEGAPTDAAASGRAREVLLAAIGDFALVGRPDSVAGQVEALREAGVDHVVGYPARGLDAFVG